MKNLLSLEQSKAELRKAHGTPKEFAAAVDRAACDGFCSWGEADIAVTKYTRAYNEAPELELDDDSEE